MWLLLVSSIPLNDPMPFIRLTQTRITIVAIGLCVLGYFVVASRPRNLILGSVPVASTSGWVVEYGNYKWASPQTVFALRQSDGANWVANRIDTKAQTSIPLREFDRVFGRTVSKDPLSWSVSPNGKWLVLNTGSETSHQWHTVGL